MCGRTRVCTHVKKSDCTMCTANIWWVKIIKLHLTDHGGYVYYKNVWNGSVPLLGKCHTKKGEKIICTLFLIKHTCSFKTKIYIHSSLYTIVQVVNTLTQTYLVFRCLILFSILFNKQYHIWLRKSVVYLNGFDTSAVQRAAFWKQEQITVF